MSLKMEANDVKVQLLLLSRANQKLTKSTREVCITCSFGWSLQGPNYREWTATFILYPVCDLNIHLYLCWPFFLGTCSYVLGYHLLKNTNQVKLP